MAYPTFLLIALLAGGLVPLSCARDRPAEDPPGAVAPPVQPSAEAPDLPYAFDQPDARHRLPGRLREISGITVLDERRLAGIQDEKGILFVLDAATGEIVEERRFGNDGDYEDLALVGSRLYILRSDGTLYELEDWTDRRPDAKKHDTDLGARYDTEGLAYDAAHDRLLIACKEYPGKDLKNRRAVYAFDLDRHRRASEPVYTLDLDALDRLRGAGKKAEGFKPSALAVHPATGQLYVISSTPPALAVLSPTGALEQAVSLPEALFAQPEGLAFLPDGDLLISNEGAGGQATLLRFRYRSQHD